VWITTFVPFTLVCLLLNRLIIKPLRGQYEPPKIDSGHEVKDKDVKPRADRTYDVVVLGATGFTGRLAVRHLAKTYGVNKSVKWAMAGRSAKKLDKIKKELAEELNIKEMAQVDTIVVDALDPSTLPKLVTQTRAVATTVGPYALYGNHVVEFCAKYGTHYVDITGELDWVRTMYMHWQDTAKKDGRSSHFILRSRQHSMGFDGDEDEEHFKAEERCFGKGLLLG
jgi:short subunit dehydrogenase-like uncharacterized protein